jgi:histidine ammonia-lyase
MRCSPQAKTLGPAASGPVPTPASTTLSMQRVADAAASVERIVASGETVYGVNTGFGLLANTRIPDDRLAELQTNLILSHSAGLGDPLPRTFRG